MLTQIHRRPRVKLATPTIFEACANELWEGVVCTLGKGHEGSHHARPSPDGCSLTWRSSDSSAALPTDGAR
jgi:hypothetical protein